MADLIKGTHHHSMDRKGTIINLKTGNIKSQWKGANGYLHVDIQEEGKARKVALHRLLALQYLPNPNNKRTVNHIDGNKLNNTLSNLEWATDSENMQHAYDTGLQPDKRKYTDKEYEYYLDMFFSGTTITELAKSSNHTLTQLSIHLRRIAKHLNRLDYYEAELKNQKLHRAKKAGKAKRRTIILHMLDKDTGKILQTFSSIAAASNYLNKKSSGPISNVLAGRHKTAYGYKWVKS